MYKCTKTCKHCGESFNASCGKEEFCSDKCKILANVEVSDDGCWNWKRSKDKNGYGYIKRKGIRTQKAHRAAYEIFNGVINEGLLVCHKCDNPSCVNPDHLFLGTDIDNVNDRSSKGRGMRGEKHHRAKFSEEQVMQILKSDLSPVDLAAMFGAHRNDIYNILNGKTWKHIPRPAS